MSGAELSGEQLHRNRIEKEPVIFDVLRRRYLEPLRKWWASYELPDFKVTKKAYLFYEMRDHPNIEFVIYNALCACEGFGLVVYCCGENLGRIREILGHNVDRAEIHVLFEKDIGREEGRKLYNETLMSLDFWSSFPAEHILICETDAYFRHKLPSHLLDYDYVGYEWPWMPEVAGGGGVSLRKKSAMIRICKESKQPPTYGADTWASNGVMELGLTFNNSYFSEASIFEEAVAVHQWWSFLDYESYNDPQFKMTMIIYLTIYIV